MTDTQTYISPFLVKPLVAGLTAGILDRYLLGNDYTYGNIGFAGTVVAGTALADYIAPYGGQLIDPLFTDTQFWAGKTLAQRIVEVSVGSALPYTVNRFLIKNDIKPAQMYKKVGVIFVSQVVGELVSDMVSSRPVSYLM